jgi:hypothetical protein
MLWLIRRELQVPQRTDAGHRSFILGLRTPCITYAQGIFQGVRKVEKKLEKVRKEMKKVIIRGQGELIIIFGQVYRVIDP